MTRTEKMIARAEANGRLVRKVHESQIACKGVEYPLANPYSAKHLRDAWERGANS